jgi:hypothetical protein
MSDNPKSEAPVTIEGNNSELSIGRKPPKAAPSIHYNKIMDTLVVLSTQSGYRADQVDKHLDLLWHDQRWEVVGIKIQGLGFLLWTNPDIVPDTDRPLPLAIILNCSLSVMETVGENRLQRKFYGIARDIAGDAAVPPDMWREALPAARP